MTREQFEHAIRAAGAVLGVSDVLVIGSQAVHGSMSGELPIEATRSVEVDVAVRGDVDGRLADLIDGSIGEASCRALLQRGVVAPTVLQDRLLTVPALDERIRQVIVAWIPS